MNTFSRTLKQLRHSRKFTQIALAEKTGLSRNQIASYESGNTEPDLETLYTLSKFFQVSVDDMLGVGVKTPDSPELESFLSQIAAMYTAINNADKEMYLEELLSFSDYLAYKISKS